MTCPFFITGTDTDAGKTFVTTLLLQKINQQGLTTSAYKPVAAGCEMTEEGLRNSDALILQSTCSEDLDYTQVNPITYADPVAPHLAAKKNANTIDVNRLDVGLAGLLARNSDVLLIEGAGGWLLPLSEEYLMSQWVAKHHIPVILVVGMKLGCINHALLTIASIQSAGLPIVGWIANQVDKHMLYLNENIATLKAQIPFPCLGVVPYVTEPQELTLAKAALDLEPLSLN